MQQAEEAEETWEFFLFLDFCQSFTNLKVNIAAPIKMKKNIRMRFTIIGT